MTGYSSFKPSIEALRTDAKVLSSAKDGTIDAGDILNGINRMDYEGIPAMYIRMSAGRAMAIGDAALILWGQGKLEMDDDCPNDIVILYNPHAVPQSRGVLVIQC